MSSEYIIKFIDTNNTTYDGFVELSKNKSNIPIINIRTHKSNSDKMNQSLLYKFMTNNFAQVSFDDETSICNLSYKDFYSSNIYNNTIIFDNSSSSAYADFKKTFNNYLNSKCETEYYPSGNEMYVGEVLYKKGMDEVVVERLPNGHGTYYYDTPSHKIKYIGDYEEGNYDGSGTFYSSDGKINVIALNISNGIPTQKGKLNINFSKKKETIEFQFNDVWEKFKFATKESKKEFVNSEYFVTSIVKLYWKDNILDELIFQDKPSSEKYTEMWKMLKLQHEQLNFINNNMNIMYQQQNNNFYKIWIASTFIILIAQFLF